eukprot:14715895-Heterocapsa_arctica.AAC.1
MFTTTHMGWKRLVRTKCQAKKKTDRTRWRANFHRSKWLQRAARKTAAGGLTANHRPEQFEDQGITKWICTKCGKCAERPCDLGKECKGAPS